MKGSKMQLGVAALLGGRPWEVGLSFQSDPLGWIEAGLRSGESLIPVSERQFCVADAGAARAILRNSDGFYKETSDFFQTRAGQFGPRNAQISLGVGVRSAIRAHLDTVDLRDAVRALPRCSEWPGAGTRLLFDLLRPVLLWQGRSPRFRKLVQQLVEQRIHGPTGRRILQRFLLRKRLLEAMRLEQAAWASERPAARDLLDLVFECADDSVPLAQMMEIYASLLFASAGSIGLALGWSVLLDVDSGSLEDPAHAVSEALRLFPIAWLMGRQPQTEHVLLGRNVSPHDLIMVCPYAVHRNPAHWPEPNSFRPERWRDRSDRSAWIPFGAGPHACVAVALTLDLVTRLLSEFRDLGGLSVAVSSRRPVVDVALRPPPFQLLR